MENSAPFDLKQFAQFMDGQPLQIQELFQFAVAMLMVEDGTVVLLDQQIIEG